MKITYLPRGGWWATPPRVEVRHLPTGTVVRAEVDRYRVLPAIRVALSVLRSRLIYGEGDGDEVVRKYSLGGTRGPSVTDLRGGIRLAGEDVEAALGRGEIDALVAAGVRAGKVPEAKL